MKKGCFCCRQSWSIGNSGSLTWRSIWSPIWRPQLSSFVEGIICSYHKHQIVAAGKAGLCKSSSAGRCASITCLYWKYQVERLKKPHWDFLVIVPMHTAGVLPCPLFPLNPGQDNFCPWILAWGQKTWPGCYFWGILSLKVVILDITAYLIDYWLWLLVKKTNA